MSGWVSEWVGVWVNKWVSVVGLVGWVRVVG